VQTLCQYPPQVVLLVGDIISVILTTNCEYSHLCFFAHSSSILSSSLIQLQQLQYPMHTKLTILLVLLTVHIWAVPMPITSDTHPNPQGAVAGDQELPSKTPNHHCTCPPPAVVKGAPGAIASPSVAGHDLPPNHHSTYPLTLLP
jgi:hypothetical protein